MPRHDQSHRPEREALGAAAGLLLASLALSSCLYISAGFDGVPLDELDMGGEPPVDIAVSGPDDVILKTGETLDITFEGDAAAIEDLRFRIDGEKLRIGRDDEWKESSGKALIRVTMPAPSAISLAGSGNLDADALASSAEISIAGSGKVTIAEIAADDLEVSVAGSGGLSGRGTARRLEISIAGSGDIVVTGNASCKTSSAGSGTVTCKPGGVQATGPVGSEAGGTGGAKR